MLTLPDGTNVRYRRGSPDETEELPARVLDGSSKKREVWSNRMPASLGLCKAIPKAKRLWPAGLSQSIAQKRPGPLLEPRPVDYSQMILRHEAGYFTAILVMKVLMGLAFTSVYTEGFSVHRCIPKLVIPI